MLHSALGSKGEVAHAYPSVVGVGGCIPLRSPRSSAGDGGPAINFGIVDLGLWRRTFSQHSSRPGDMRSRRRRRRPLFQIACNARSGAQNRLPNDVALSRSVHPTIPHIELLLILGARTMACPVGLVSPARHLLAKTPRRPVAPLTFGQISVCQLLPTAPWTCFSCINQ